MRATTVGHFHRLERYWKQNPPEHVIGRAFIKIKASDPAVPATKISPDARSAEERAADDARVAQIRATAVKADAGFNVLQALAAKHGGMIRAETLRGL